MKMTFNRRLFLFALSKDDDLSQPPYSAQAVAEILENAYEFGWPGLYEEMKSVPNKQQIHRTLRELWLGGFIIGSRIKDDGAYYNLPRWIVHYQVSSTAISTLIIDLLVDECEQIHRQVQIARYNGLSPDNRNALMTKVKRMMQKTHPDKSDGRLDLFLKMTKCRDDIRGMANM